MAAVTFTGFNVQTPSPTTQCQLMRRCTRRKHQDYCGWQRRSVHKSGQDCHPVEDQHNGTRLKTHRFLLSENDTVRHWQDCCGKESSKKFFSHKFGKSSNLVLSLCPPKSQLFFSVCVDDIKMDGKIQMSDQFGKFCERTST